MRNDLKKQYQGSYLGLIWTFTFGFHIDACTIKMVEADKAGRVNLMKNINA